MIKRIVLGLFPVILGLGCSGELELGGGPEGDARLTADIYTWECTDLGDTLWEGVYGFTVALEFAPDGVQSRELPAPGDCSADLSMFPKDAGNAGSDIPESDGDPAWATTTSEGELESMADGFWYDNAMGDNHSCFMPEEIVSSGIELTDAASLSGAMTPPSGTLGTVVLGDGTHTGALTFGEDMNVSWESDGWDESWIQVRMEREGQSWGTVTCNTTGLGSFNVDNRVWSKLNGDLNVEYINLYVGFQNNGKFVSESGIKVDTVTRAIHVEVVNEI